MRGSVKYNESFFLGRFLRVWVSDTTYKQARMLDQFSRYENTSYFWGRDTLLLKTNIRSVKSMEKYKVLLAMGRSKKM